MCTSLPIVCIAHRIMRKILRIALIPLALSLRVGTVRSNN